MWHKPLLCVQWKSPDDIQRHCPKHVEFNSKNKFENLDSLVGFIIRNFGLPYCLQIIFIFNWSLNPISRYFYSNTCKTPTERTMSVYKVLSWIWFTITETCCQLCIIDCIVCVVCDWMNHFNKAINILTAYPSSRGMRICGRLTSRSLLLPVVTEGCLGTQIFMIRIVVVSCACELIFLFFIVCCVAKRVHKCLLWVC